MVSLVFFLDLLENLYSLFSRNEKSIDTMVSMPTPATKCMKCSDRGYINCSTDPEECAECEDECKRCISGSACLADMCHVWYTYEIGNDPYYKNTAQNCPLRCKVKNWGPWMGEQHYHYGSGCFDKRCNLEWFPYLLRGKYLSAYDSSENFDGHCFFFWPLKYNNFFSISKWK